MAATDDLFAVARTSADAVVLGVARTCTPRELCAALPASKSARHRFLTQDLAGIGRLEAGAEVVLSLVEPRVASPRSDEPVRVLWHDRFALAADKPAGLLVHTDGTDAPTLTARVQGALAREAAKNGWPLVPVAQAVNRLDVDTSGIVLFSLTQEFQPAFDALVAHAHDGRMHKRYVAIVEGAFPRAPRIIDAPIARDRHHAGRMRVGPTGKPSRTRVACLDVRGGHSLVACELLSGRRHQIRVHLAHVGHPIVGDALYGGGRPRTKAGLMLHASHVDFEHPVTGKQVTIDADWPSRFARLFAPRSIDW